jgi:hypothetical protein
MHVSEVLEELEKLHVNMVGKVTDSNKRKRALNGSVNAAAVEFPPAGHTNTMKERRNRRKFGVRRCTKIAMKIQHGSSLFEHVEAGSKW